MTGFLEGFFEAFLEFGAAFHHGFRQGAQGGEDVGLEFAAFEDFFLAGGFVLFLGSGEIGEGFGGLQAGEAFFRDLEIEAQRAVDLDAAVTESGRGEDLDVVGFLPRGEEAEDGVFRAFDSAAFVADGFGEFFPEGIAGGIEEHHIALLFFGFVSGEDPEIGLDAGVVEHLLGQSHEGHEPILFQNPAADF
jgi:hypothetical protein